MKVINVMFDILRIFATPKISFLFLEFKLRATPSFVCSVIGELMPEKKL